MSVSNTLIEFLAEMEVSHLYGVSGAKIERFLHDVHVAKQSITVVVTKHEAVAMAAADSTAKCGALIGAAAVTSGGAAFNIVPALAEAYSKNTPLFVIVGQPGNTVNHRGGFQESSGRNGTPDLAQTLSSVSRWCKRLEDASLLPAYLGEIERLLRLEQSGPAVLLVPENVFQDSVLIMREPVGATLPSLRCNTQQIKSIHPSECVLIAGGEVRKQKAFDALDAMAAALQIPVVTVSDAKDVVDNRAGYYAGAIGAMGHRSAFAAVEKASQVLLIGARCREIDRLSISLQNKECFFVGREAPFLERYTSLGEDIAAFCTAFATGRSSESGELDITVSVKEYPAENLYVETLSLLNREMDVAVNILVDAGNGGAYAMHYLFPPRGTQLNIALTMGGMGYSFGAALGAVLYNKRRTYQIAGDGSFFMHGFEIETALRMTLPITYIIFDNSGHQMCVTREELFFNERSGNNSFLHSRVGKGFRVIYDDLPAFDIYSAEQLRVQFAKHKAHEGPLLFVIHVTDDMIPPFLPFERETL